MRLHCGSRWGARLLVCIGLGQRAFELRGHLAQSVQLGQLVFELLPNGLLRGGVKVGKGWGGGGGFSGAAARAELRLGSWKDIKLKWLTSCSVVSSPSLSSASWGS
jgi:hypothetical protein